MGKDTKNEPSEPSGNWFSRYFDKDVTENKGRVAIAAIAIAGGCYALKKLGDLAKFFWPEAKEITLKKGDLALTVTKDTSEHE